MRNHWPKSLQIKPGAPTSIHSFASDFFRRRRQGVEIQPRDAEKRIIFCYYRRLELDPENTRNTLKVRQATEVAGLSTRNPRRRLRLRRATEKRALSSRCSMQHPPQSLTYRCSCNLPSPREEKYPGLSHAVDNSSHSCGKQTNRRTQKDAA